MLKDKCKQFTPNTEPKTDLGNWAKKIRKLEDQIRQHIKKVLLKWPFWEGDKTPPSENSRDMTRKRTDPNNQI